MTTTDTQYVLRPRLTEEDAWEVIEEREPHVCRIGVSLTHHPFSGFVHLVRHPGLPKDADSSIHTLVDRLTGRAYITEAWPLIEHASDACDFERVTDPGWNTITYEQARENATRLLRTAALRRYRLARFHTVEEQDGFELIWKPNWVLSAVLDNREFKVLVDGLNGGYYVIGT